MAENRTTRFIQGLATGSFSIGINALYTMGSIPVALHYLSKEEFGLWALITQLTGYFALIDFGMSGAVSRHLIDHKDQKNGGSYGSFIQTGFFVGAIQGVFVALAGALSSSLIGSAVGLPATFRNEFQILFAIQCIMTGGGFVFRSFGNVLFANQRLDVINLVNSVGFVLSFLSLWLGFSLGMKLYAMVFSSIIGFVWINGAYCVSVLRLKLLPERNCWGYPNKPIFIELFGYCKDVFLLGLGWQFLSASQVIIITRVMGLDAGATWSVCTKAYALVQRLVWQVSDVSYAGFSEMMVRGERERLSQRFKDSLILSGSLGVFVAVTCAVCNGSFLLLWTQGRIVWDPLNDILWCILFVFNNINRCHGVMYGVSKNIGFAKWIYFIEGLVFVGIAIFFGGWIGFPGIILCSIIVDFLFPGWYGYYRSIHFFKAAYKDVIFGWSAPCFRFFALFAGLGFACWTATSELMPTWKLGVSVTAMTILGVPLFWWVGLTKQLRRDIQKRVLHVAPTSSGLSAEL